MAGDGEPLRWPGMARPAPFRRRLAALPLLFVAACAAAASAMPSPVRLVHDVYFTLKASTPQNRAALVAECYARLAGIDGIVAFAAGTRDEDLSRPVNDRDYDVSLHVWFADRAAHDAYQTAPAHLAFVERNQAAWQKVRVFDSTVAAP